MKICEGFITKIHGSLFIVFLIQVKSQESRVKNDNSKIKHSTISTTYLNSFEMISMHIRAGQSSSRPRRRRRRRGGRRKSSRRVFTKTTCSGRKICVDEGGTDFSITEIIAQRCALYKQKQTQIQIQPQEKPHRQEQS